MFALKVELMSEDFPEPFYDKSGVGETWLSAEYRIYLPSPLRES